MNQFRHLHGSQSQETLTIKLEAHQENVLSQDSPSKGYLIQEESMQEGTKMHSQSGALVLFNKPR